MYKYTLILLSLLSLGCHMNKQEVNIEWKVAGQLPDSINQAHVGVAGPIAGIINNKLIVAGGANFPYGMPWDGGNKVYQKDVYIYSINEKGELNYSGRQDFQDSIAYAANISLDDKIYSAGGERNGKATSDVFVYYFEAGKLRRQDTILASLPLPLTNGALTQAQGKLYFVGGENAEIVSNKIFELDLNLPDPVWTEFIELPRSLSHAVALSDSQENIFILGGRKRNNNAKSDIYDEVLKINVRTKRVQKLPALPEPLAAGTGVFYADHIYMIAGDNGETFHQVEELIGAINLSTDDAKKQTLIKQKNSIQEGHPGFGKKVWTMHLKDEKWQSAAVILGESPVTTTAILYDNTIVIPSGEIRAGVRTNQILSGKMQ